jgi:hypothetical protein
VRVDEEDGRELPKRFDLAVGLGLRSREPVPVQVESVGVLPRVGFPTVWILDRQYHDDRVVEDLPGRAVGAGGEPVQDAERGIRSARLVPMDIGRNPQNRRRRSREVVGLVGRCEGISERLD